MEIPKLNTEVLYSTGIAAGLGSNDIGLDRGALAGSRIVKFERVGPRVLIVQPNYRFRAITDNAGGSPGRPRRRSRDRCSGASRSPPPSGDRVLVDATEFLVRDSDDMAGRAAARVAIGSSRTAARSTCR